MERDCSGREETTRDKARIWDAALFVGGFVAALGKNEWSLVLLVSLGAAFRWVWLRTFSPLRKASDARAESLSILCALAGLLLGNVASYLFDPLNYRMGLELMLSMSKGQSIVRDPTKLSKWLWLTKIRWHYVTLSLLMVSPLIFLVVRFRPFLRVAGEFLPIGILLAWPCIVALGGKYLPSNTLLFFLPIVVVVFSMAIWYKVFLPAQGVAQPAGPVLACAIFSVALLAAYFFSTWHGGPRYFSVTLVTSLLILLGLLKHVPGDVEKKVVVTLTVCVLALNFTSWLAKDTFFRIVHDPLPAAALKETGCLRVLSSGEAAFSNVDFLGSSCGTEYFERMSRRYGRPLCK